jgi:hypothetical protein
VTVRVNADKGVPITVYAGFLVMFEVVSATVRRAASLNPCQ